MRGGVGGAAALAPAAAAASIPSFHPGVAPSCFNIYSSALPLFRPFLRFLSRATMGRKPIQGPEALQACADLREALRSVVLGRPGVEHTVYLCRLGSTTRAAALALQEQLVRHLREEGRRQLGGLGCTLLASRVADLG